MLRLGFLLGRTQVDAHAYHGGILTRHGRRRLGLMGITPAEDGSKFWKNMTQPMGKKHVMLYSYIWLNHAKS